MGSPFRYSQCTPLRFRVNPPNDSLGLTGIATRAPPPNCKSLYSQATQLQARPDLAPQPAPEMAFALDILVGLSLKDAGVSSVFGWMLVGESIPRYIQRERERELKVESLDLSSFSLSHCFRFCPWFCRESLEETRKALCLSDGAFAKKGFPQLFIDVTNSSAIASGFVSLKIPVASSEVPLKVHRSKWLATDSWMTPKNCPKSKAFIYAPFLCATIKNHFCLPHAPSTHRKLIGKVASQAGAIARQGLTLQHLWNPGVGEAQQLWMPQESDCQTNLLRARILILLRLARS